jgi:hypothetical protein
VGHVQHHRRTFTQEGQDLLRVLAMDATTQEIAVTDTSATSMVEKPQGRKTGQSGM